MPHRNRVDPHGRLVATPERGAWHGNRGVLHDEHREIVVDWRVKRWITCLLEFKGRRREVFTPRRYTELFFLDEATSFAAGHRPCAECRRARFEEFRAAWATANPGLASSARPKVDIIDNALHAERIAPDGRKRTYRAALPGLPDGAMFERDGAAHLKWRGRAWRWSVAGYTDAGPASDPGEVAVLTPRSVVLAFAAGLTPQAHL